jgi:outer membrane receptor protein involved in Fe transport
MKSRRLFACLCGLLVLAFTQYARTQATLTYAVLNGSITDEGGRAVVQAKVTLRSLDTNQTFSALSSGSGYYAIPNLPPGRYDISVTAPGFGTYQSTGVELTVAQTATVNVQLKVASVQEKVVVNATEAPVIETTSSEVSQVVDKQQVQDLPTSNRLFTDFALLTPGVATSRTSLGTTITEFEVTQISFGGMRSFSNELTVDGADFVNSITGVQRATPPQDSVEAFRVVNNSFGAEYGRALGGIVNIVTRSGTNKFNGSVYDYLQNGATDARSYLQPAPLPHAVRENQFGFTLGGPIAKDKTFYFVNYEGHRRGASPTYAPDMEASIVNLDIAKGYLGLAPEGCNLKPLDCTATPQQYLKGVLQTQDNDYGFARIDHRINANNNFALRYNIEDARDLGELIGATEDGGGIGTPSGARNLFVRDQALVGTLNTVLKPTLVNTVLVQYARRHYNFPGATGEPDLDVVNDLSFGHNFGIFDAIYDTRFEASDSVSWVKGNHVAKFGFDGNYIWGHNNYPGFTPARILFPNQGCLFAFADFVEELVNSTPGTLDGSSCPLAPEADGVSFLYTGTELPRTNGPGGFQNGYVPPPATGGGYNSGWPSAFPTNLYPNTGYALNHGYWGFFGQDQWRVTPKLVLNYGLRWDFESGLGSTLDSDYTGFAPRVGFAYSPNANTVIHGGGGIFFDRNNMSFLFVTGNQKTLPGYFCNPASADPACATSGLTPVVAPMINTNAPSGGWQLGGLPGFPGTPANVLAEITTGILLGAPYLPETLTGPCTLGEEGLEGACGVGSGGMQKNPRLPYAEQASLQIEHQFGKGFALEVGYLFVGAHKLIRGNNINVPCPIGTSKPDNPADAQGWLNPDGTLTACQGTPTLGPFGLGPFFGYLYNPANALLPVNPSGLEFGTPGAPGQSTLSGGLLDYNNGVVNSNYHGLTLSANERMKYFHMVVNYTYSHTIDNGNFETFINLPINQFDYSAERANSNQDLRHHLVANLTATAPDHTFMRNFELSSIITLQSGRPFTLYPGANVLGDLAGLDTDRVGGPPVTGACTSVSNCAPAIGRNTYVGAAFYAWDLRLSRNFKLSEDKAVLLSVDSFNLLNHPNMDELNSVYGSAVFCGATPTIPKHFNDATTRAIQQGAPSVSCLAGGQVAAGNPGAWLSLPGGAAALPVSIPDAPNPVFGTQRTMFNPRQFQFSAKFSF